MERDDTYSAAWAKSPHRWFQKAFDLSELIIDRDPEGLEGACRRVNATVVAPKYALDQTTQLSGRAQGRVLASFNDGAGDRPRTPLLPKVAQDLHQLIPFQALKKIRSGRALNAHSHVEGAIGLEREASLRVIKLERRAPKVGENRRRWFQVETFDDLRQLVEGFLDQSHPITKNPQSLTGTSQRMGVTVEPDKPEIGFFPKQCPRMSSQADRGVDDEPWGGRRKKLHHAIGKNGQVFGGHFRPPSKLQLRELF
jgi:hypothetical protein